MENRISSATHQSRISDAVPHNKESDNDAPSQQHQTTTTTMTTALTEPVFSTSTAATNSPSLSTTSALQKEKDPRTCVLRKGDLVRIVERREARMKNRDGGLGRIVRQIPTPQEDPKGPSIGGDSVENHPYLYDVDFVLGGRIASCHRRDLIHTTAEAEGMLADSGSMRAKRKRKPSSVVLESQGLPDPQSGKKTAKKKNKAAGGGKRKGSTTPSTAPTAAVVKKKGGGGAKASTAAAARKGNSTRSNKQTADTKQTANDPEFQPFKDEIVVKDLYERHKRDFERSMTRLEKVDQFGFLFEKPEEEQPPPQQQSPPNKSEPLVSSVQVQPAHAMSQSMLSAPVLNQSQPMASLFAAQPSPTQSSSAPSQSDESNAAAALTALANLAVLTSEPTTPHPVKAVETPSAVQETAVPAPAVAVEAEGGQAPSSFFGAPITWYDIRERKEAGWYDMDRMKVYEKERMRRLGPYRWYRRKKILNKDNEKKVEKWDVLEQYDGRDKGGKVKVTLKDVNGHRVHPRVLHPKGIDWDLFRSDVLAMCSSAVERDPEGTLGGSGTLGHAANKIKNALEEIYERTGKRHRKEMEAADARHEFTILLRGNKNQEAAMQGHWRKEAFPERKYEPMTSNVICAGLSSVDEQSAKYELRTTLPDSFVGLSYTYNDTGESEGWMKTVVGEAAQNGASKKRTRTEDTDEQRAAKALAADDGVVRAQVLGTMRTLLIGVQDRVMTDNGVLNQQELAVANWKDKQEDLVRPVSNEDRTKSSLELLTEQRRRLNPDLVEQFVWGLDCYTRRNIMICVEKDLDPETAVEFIEKWLLPAINAVPPDLAHDLIHAARILEGLPLQNVNEQGASKAPKQKEESDTQTDINEEWSNSMIGKALLQRMKQFGAPWLHAAAHQLRRAIEALGHDFFRVHPKGQGSIVLKPKIKANTLVTFYRGEVYPSWRWGEKMDAIDLTQKHIGLRPNLPDFYNMALERPQKDPRGYGMMIVDASRRAGHGSMLSHSCAPTCEVRVAAARGEFVLAMTTLRDIEQGEELTFDYNAVTESLNEYQAAVCLCGYDKCRGSFLHFATADCYQEILNRNSPIAVRFSNLVKGCMKKVMSDQDTVILKTHGFGTAAFGGASFDIRLIDQNGPQSGGADSLDNVPTWLRTFVADSLRYIEYERRALPISLICDHIKQQRQKQPLSPAKPIVKRNPPAPKPTKKKEKKKKESKPAPAFHFYVRKNRQAFLETLGEAAKSLKGLELESAIRKVAGRTWGVLSGENKAYWKELSIQEWKEAQKQQGGESGAQGGGDKSVGQEKKSEPEKKKTEASSAANKPTPATKREKKARPTKKDEDWIGDISFEAADAEGVSSMEQRIQQLTQTLSRVGRVLARHREAVSSDPGTTSTDVSPLHAPLTIMSDREVVALTWNEETGLVKSLLRLVAKEKCVTDGLRDTMQSIVAKYSILETGGKKWIPNARKQLKRALVELSECLQDGVSDLARDMKKFELDRNRARAKIRRERETEAKAAKMTEQQVADTSLVSGLGAGGESMKGSHVSNLEAAALLKSFQQSSADEKPKPSPEPEAEMSACLAHFHDRWKLEAASDVLLMYANTSTFFKLVPYSPLDSTPIEVYSRELGNEVPRYKILESHSSQSASSGINLIKHGDEKNDPVESGNARAKKGSEKKKQRSDELCDPEEAIATVTISYKGDYVLSQLLQWYNGGIGQKPGLPEMLGCVTLPTIQACFKESNKLPKLKKGTTAYKLQIRPTLYDWLKDPHKRGSTFPGEMGRIFSSDEDEKLFQLENPGKVLLGSPVLDFLVSGDDSGILRLLGLLHEHGSTEADDGSGRKSAADRLESTLDEGMPAQAIAKWVQCENPQCLKWRRLPFYVDLDVLPEKFFCKDNIWNASAQSCDSLEDVWDENDAKVQGDGVDKASDADMLSEQSANGKLERFEIGDRYDVLRTGKSLFCTGEVVDKDVRGEAKRVKFHFPKVPDKFDEWIDIPSDRIAPLDSKQALQRQLGKGKKKVSTVAQKNAKAAPNVNSSLPVVQAKPDGVSMQVEKEPVQEMEELPAAEVSRVEHYLPKRKREQSHNREELPSNDVAVSENMPPSAHTRAEAPQPQEPAHAKNDDESSGNNGQATNSIPRKSKQQESQKPSSMIPRKNNPPMRQKSPGLIPRKPKESTVSSVDSNLFPRKKARIDDISAASKLVMMAMTPVAPLSEPRKSPNETKQEQGAVLSQQARSSFYRPSGSRTDVGDSTSHLSRTANSSSLDGGGSAAQPPVQPLSGAKPSRWVPRSQQHHVAHHEPAKSNADESKHMNHPLLGSRFVPRSKNT